MKSKTESENTNVPDWDSEDNPYLRRWREMSKLANQSIDQRDEALARVKVLTATCYEMLQHLKSEPAVDAKIAPDEYYRRWEAALCGEKE